jgi:hypothetical protein
MGRPTGPAAAPQPRLLARSRAEGTLDEEPLDPSTAWWLAGSHASAGPAGGLARGWQARPRSPTREEVVPSGGHTSNRCDRPSSM